MGLGTAGGNTIGRMELLGNTWGVANEGYEGA